MVRSSAISASNQSRPSAGASFGNCSGLAFTVRVDGTTVASPTFSLPPASGGGKVSVVLAMDMSSSVQNNSLEAMQQAVISFIDSMQAGDYAAIVKFNNTNPDKASVVLDFTPIDDGGAGDVALKSAVTAPYIGSGSNVLDGVTLAINELQSPSVALPTGPKAIVLVSDGRDNASTATLDSVVAAATAASIPVFTIGVGDLTTAGGRLLSDLATRTGAEYIAAPDNGDIAEAYARISQRLGNEYLLTFDSSITDCN